MALRTQKLGETDRIVTLLTPGHGRVRAVALRTVRIMHSSSDGSAFLDAEGRLTNFRRVLERTEEKALTPEKTRDFLHDVAKQL